MSSGEEHPVLDLDALAEAERAMTPAKWLWSDKRKRVDATQIAASGGVYDRYSFGPVDIDADLWDAGDAETWARDARGIVALRNAAPHLIADGRKAGRGEADHEGVRRPVHRDPDDRR